VSVSALSARAYTATLYVYVMVNIVKVGERATPTYHDEFHARNRQLLLCV
jgi:hypothetical protein